jgi:transglutaminase-like putative cysteine protease
MTTKGGAMKQKWVLIGLCAVVCVVGAVGLYFTISEPKPPPPDPPNLALEVKVVPQVMTSVYKAYSSGDKLFATTTITNNGKDPVKDFQITYSIPGYIQNSGQENYSVILPGQTVVDWCYPSFPLKKMKEINSPIDVELHVTYSYQGSNGEKGTSAHTQLLAHRDMVWSTLPESQIIDWYDYFDNAPMLAAFVTKDDPMVQKFAKLCAKGLSTDSDDGAYAAAEAIFNGLFWMDIKYVSEPGSFWKENGQNVQFPADTFENTAGNCVDLSVLMAACFEAVGIKSSLCLCTNHCMVAITLPESQDYYVIEATTVGNRDVSFDEAIEIGYQTNNEEIERGTWWAVDLEYEWGNGMVPSW